MTPLATWIGGRDWSRAVWDRVCWIRYVAAMCTIIGRTRRLKAQGAIRTQVELGDCRVLQRPLRISAPHVAARLEDLCTPLGLGPLAVQPVSKERRQDFLPEFTCSFVTQRPRPELVLHRPPPAAVAPRARDHQIGVIGVAFGGVSEYFPRSPGVFLVPETRHVEIRNRRAMEGVDPDQ